MFERSLQDVVKGLRAQPTSEGRIEYASMVLQECKKELASTDGGIKSNAVLKVAHLRMLGYDDRNVGDDDTSFHVIETMALQPFKQKRIGYLAASTMLMPDSPVLLLVTNSLKKELQSSEMYGVGLALGSSSNFTSRDLARDLLPDVIAVATTAIKPYIRKRGTLSLYRLCTRYPEGLREGAYDALRSRLDDSDNSVVSCAVNAVCELAKANPKNVLPLTPQLFQLLTSSGNNWLTIKVVKLYSSLLAVEPRLAKKLLDPLAHIIKSTSAKSLLFECISTVTKALHFVAIQDDDSRKKVDNVVSLCANKLKEFVKDSDQNLKYLGLVGFVELTKSFPYVAQEHKDLVLLCLNDEDVTVRLRALELLAGMANKNTVSGIVSRLLEHLAKAPPGKFRDAVVQTCIDACADNNFERVPSCEWFFAVLMDLSRLGKGAHGPLLAKNIVNVPMRVQAVRAFAANACGRLLLETDVPEVASQVLASCAFVAAEYVDRNDVASRETSLKLIPVLLAEDEGLEKNGENVIFSKRTKPVIPPQVRAIYVLNAFKLAVKMNSQALALNLSQKWLKSSSFRVKERVRWCQAWIDHGDKSFFNDDANALGPVHPKAQKKVPLPSGLDLNMRKCSQTQVTTVSKVAVSFRGVPRASPSTSSTSLLPGSQYAPRKVNFVDPANTFTPFKLPSSPDPSPFLLGKNETKASKRSKSKKKHDDVEEEVLQEDEETNEKTRKETERAAVSATLWSANLGKTTSFSPTVVDHPAGSNGGVVMAPQALPAGTALREEDYDDDLGLKKKKQANGHLTLADVDINSDGEQPFMAKDDLGEKSGKSSKDKSTKKDKDEKKKKKKSKQLSKSKKESQVEEAPLQTKVEEKDLLDFSEL